MDFLFASKKELFERVKPALHAKEIELKRLGYSNVTSIDIWNFLIQDKWINGKDLMLSDIVDDIMKADCVSLSNYSKNKSINHSGENNNLEVI